MNEKTEYDFAFPLGAACASSQALRLADMQFASLPFDWIAGGNVVGRAKLVAEGFRDWFRQEDLELTDIIHASFHSSVYRNKRTGLTYPHDFPSSCYLEDEFPAVAAKYERRVRRLYEEVEKSSRVLVVYNEIPYRPVAAESDVLEAQRLIQSRFPRVSIDLVYFAQDPECRDRSPRRISDNATMILLDYHSVASGYVAMSAQYHKMILYLKRHCVVADRRTPEQKARFELAGKEKERARWGVGFRHWINKRAYRLYRHLEKYLQRQACLPDMACPMKLYEDRGERRRSLAEPDVSFMAHDAEKGQSARLFL